MNLPVCTSRIAKAQLRWAGVGGGWPLSPSVDTLILTTEMLCEVLNLTGGLSEGSAVAAAPGGGGVD